MTTVKHKILPFCVETLREQRSKRKRDKNFVRKRDSGHKSKRTRTTAKKRKAKIQLQPNIVSVRRRMSHVDELHALTTSLATKLKTKFKQTIDSFPLNQTSNHRYFKIYGHLDMTDHFLSLLWEIWLYFQDGKYDAEKVEQSQMWIAGIKMFTNELQGLVLDIKKGSSVGHALRRYIYTVHSLVHAINEWIFAPGNPGFLMAEADFKMNSAQLVI